MKQHPPLRPLRLGLTGLTACVSLAAQATSLPLQQGPWGLTKGPAPNIIISVDNSSSMGTSGIASLKNALKATFAADNIPDNKIRIAWQAMHGCNTIPSANTSTTGPCKGFNGMRRLAGDHRSTFNNWVDSLTYASGTPTHWTMAQAGDYLAATGLGVNSPWAYKPGEQESPVLACRRSYNILMTDGEYGHAAWTTGMADMSGANGVRIYRGGNADGTTTTLPDGTQYDTDIRQNETRLYRDSWGSAKVSTLSDLAFYYWSRDLQPDIPNGLTKLDRRSGEEDFGTAAKPAKVQEYWNPRNDPATWQHMVTYTIGFKDAASWTGAPVWSNETYSGLGPLLLGEVTWPSPFCGADGQTPCDGPNAYTQHSNPRKAELWHAALNSRGRFVPAPNAQALKDAFAEILNDIASVPSAATVGMAARSGRRPADDLVYDASYDTTHWSGNVMAFQRKASGTIDATPTWAADAKLDKTKWQDRRLFTSNSSGGAAFTWDNIGSDNQTALLGSDDAEIGKARLNYLRGDRTQEAGPSKGPFASRTSSLGSIINSKIWITPPPQRLSQEWPGHADFRKKNNGRPRMLYVGANDGFLHAFNGATGDEQFAYFPQGVFGAMRLRSTPGTVFKASMDGQPFTGDADLNLGPKDVPEKEPQWRTLLAAGLGAGGRGYVVLDVTDPIQFDQSKVLVDRTSAANASPSGPGGDDIGHQLYAPVTDGVLSSRSESFVKLNNGHWALLLGNGVNSKNERPVLLIQYLDGDRSLITLVAQDAVGTGNGLSSVRPIDVDGNGTADVVYAGDLKGQLWKFSLISTDASSWGVVIWDGKDETCKASSAVPDCKPFLKVVDPTNPAIAQPITTVPVWRAHPQGGIQLVFGTGRLWQPNDPADLSVQSVYSVWDMSTYPSTVDKVLHGANTNPLNEETDVRSRLVEQPVLGALPVADAAAAVAGKTIDDAYFTSASNAVKYSRTDSKAPRGWYMNLPVSGERLVTHPQTFVGGKVLLASTAPPPEVFDESCTPGDPGGRYWLNVRDMISGLTPIGGAFEAPQVITNLATSSRALVSSSETLVFPGANGKFLLLQKQCPNGVCPTILLDKPPGPIRTDWRELTP